MTLLLGAALAWAAALRTFEAEAMATRFTVAVADDPAASEDAAAAFRVVRDVEIDANEWRPGSPIAEVNRAAGGAAVPVPDDTLRLVARAVELGRRTHGAFDVTWAALWGLWDFGTPRVPDAADVAARLPLIDASRVEVGDHTLRLPLVGMKLGLGGIAKGWALDRVAATLRARGRVDFLVSAGGQVYAGGSRPDGAPWRIGVRDPRGGEADSLCLVAVRDASVSTSGDYERYFEVGGVRYHHILDPRTGFPTRGLRAATVVSADATLADAASTALMVAGAGALGLATELGVEALVVDDRGGVRVTPGFPTMPGTRCVDGAPR